MTKNLLKASQDLKCFQKKTLNKKKKTKTFQVKCFRTNLIPGGGN